MALVKSQICKSLIFIFTIFLISRIGIYTVSYFGYNLFSKYTVPTAYSTSAKYTRMELPEHVKDTHILGLDSFVKFDSGFYLKIAQDGYNRYKMDEKHPPANWPFFPLYPMLMSLIHSIIPLKMSTIGFLLSNLFAILTLFYMYRIAMEISGGDEEVSQRSIIYLLIFPASLYLSIIYTESLFMFLSALSVYLLLKKRIGLSILFASLSTVTRVPGIVNLFIIGLFLLKDASFNPLKIRLKHYILMILSCIPLISFFTYMKFLTGDFFAVFNEMANWGRKASSPFIGYFGYLLHPVFVTFSGWDLTLASFIITTSIFIILIAYAIVYRSNYEILLYALLLILIPLYSESTSMTSIVRYSMACFPLFIFMGMLAKKSRLLDFLFIVIFFSFNIIYTIGFINSYFFVV